MAEMLVRTVDKPLSGDPYTDRHRSMRGCVITIMPDGHPWSQEERNAPFWRIVKFPGLAFSQLSQFLAPEVGYGTDTEKFQRTLQRWRHTLDLDSLDDLLTDTSLPVDADGNRKPPLGRVLALLKVRPRLPDPAVLGGYQNVVRVIG